MRDPTRWLGALAVLAVVLLLLLGRGDDVSRPGLDRLLAYNLDQPVRFALEAGERDVRLVTWLATPPALLADNRAAETYALGIRVSGADGAAILDRTVWIPTHRSWLSFDDRARPQRLEESPDDVWDDRTTRVDVRGFAPEGGTIEVRPVRVPRDGRIFLVAHRRSEASALERIRTLRRGDLDAGPPVAPWPMSSLPTAWQENEARESWERLGALPPDEGGIPTSQRLDTWFRRLPTLDGPAVGTPVWPGRGLTWLLDGETTFEATISTDYGATRATDDGQLRVRRADGSEALARLTGGVVGPLAIDGPTEISWVLDPSAPGARWVEARTHGGPPDRAQGEPPRIAIDDDNQAVAPDFREITAWRVLPDQPVSFPISPGLALRIAVRRPLSGAGPGLDPPTPAESVPITLEALDGDGTVLATFELPFAAVASPFERYVMGEDEGTVVSEPLSDWPKVPPPTAVLRVSAPVPVDVALDGTDRPDQEPIPLPEYVLPEDVPWEYHYEPHAERGWYSRSPLDEEALARDGRAIAIDAQVRWEPPAAAEGGPAEPPRSSLALRGPFELLAEADPTGGKVRVDGRPTLVHLPPSGRLEVAYRVPVASVGRTVAIQVGARTVERSLSAAGGTLRVDGASSGLVAITGVDGLFLAAGAGSPAWQVRRVWAVEDGAELAIPIPAGAGSISVDAYRLGAGGRVRWRLDDGGPEPIGTFDQASHHSGAVEHAWRGHADAVPLSYAGAPLSPLAPIAVDRYPGAPAATLVLLPEGTGRIWVRAQATWAIRPEEAPRHARESVEP